MTTATRMIAPAEERWPAADQVPADSLGQLVHASNLLGLDRAVANFGGGNTSAKGTGTDHVGRELGVIWVKGSGSELATRQASAFTGLRLKRGGRLFERDDERRGDGRPTGALPAH